MDIDPTDDLAPDTDTWLDDVGDFLAGVGESITDFLLPDVPADLSGELVGGDTTTTGVETGADLPNDGFYQSLPGMDTLTGQILDDTYQLIDDMDDFGVETFGQEAWDETMVAVHNDTSGLLEGIETPAEMQLRFAQDDAAAADRFGQWQSEQEAGYASDHADKVISDSEWLAWNTDSLLKRDW